MRDNERKQKALNRLSAVPLNYAIIRDLINSASHGVHIEVKLPGGVVLEIKRDDPFDKIKKNYTEAF